MTATKRCPKCRGVKTTSAFGTNRSLGDGLSFYCLDCNRARNNRWYREHRRKQGKEVRDLSWVPDGFRWCPTCQQAVAHEDYVRTRGRPLGSAVSASPATGEPATGRTGSASTASRVRRSRTSGHGRTTGARCAAIRIPSTSTTTTPTGSSGPSSVSGATSPSASCATTLLFCGQPRTTWRSPAFATPSPDVAASLVLRRAARTWTADRGSRR